DLRLHLAALVAIDRLDLAHALLRGVVAFLEQELERLGEARLAHLVRTRDHRHAARRERDLALRDAAVVAQAHAQHPQRVASGAFARRTSSASASRATAASGVSPPASAASLA